MFFKNRVQNIKVDPAVRAPHIHTDDDMLADTQVESLVHLRDAYIDLRLCSDTRDQSARPPLGAKQRNEVPDHQNNFDLRLNVATATLNGTSTATSSHHVDDPVASNVRLEQCSRCLANRCPKKCELAGHIPLA